MKNVITLLRRLVGCIGIALCLSVIVFGGSTFVFKVIANTDISVTLFVVAFILMLALLIACNLLYLVNQTLWNAVEEAKANSDDQNLLWLLPNVKFFVDMCEYVGTFHQNSTS